MLGSDKVINKTIIQSNMKIWKKIFGLEQNDYQGKMLKGSADCFSGAYDSILQERHELKKN